jgi:hypothetical protein
MFWMSQFLSAMTSFVARNAGHPPGFRHSASKTRVNALMAPCGYALENFYRRACIWPSTAAVGQQSSFSPFAFW